MSSLAGAKAISAVHRGDVVEIESARTFAVRGSTGTPYAVTLVVMPGTAELAATCTCAAGRQDVRCWHVAAARLQAHRTEA